MKKIIFSVIIGYFAWLTLLLSIAYAQNPYPYPRPRPFPVPNPCPQEYKSYPNPIYPFPIFSNTDILFTSKHCAPCQKAKVIVEQMVREGYNIRIIDMHGGPWEQKLALDHYIKSVPTLIIRTHGIEVGRYFNIYDAGRYRQLIEKKNPYGPLFGMQVRENYTGVLEFTSGEVEINVVGYKRIPISEYPELAERFKVDGPCVLVLVRGKVITRT